MTIAVTGATGQLGRLIITKLVAAGQPVIALARSPEKAADLGTEVRAFDYDQPDTLAPALNGIDTLMLVSASEIGKRTAQHQNVITAAKAAGVARIVYTSVLHADRSTLGLAQEHRDTEAALAAAGIPTTILRNGWYTENYAASIPSALEHGAFVGSAGDGKIASASREDYADAAVAVLTAYGHDGKVYELAGDTAYTLSDLAAELSSQSGKTIPYADMPEADYAGVLTGAGFPAPMAQAFAGFDTAAEGGALHDDGRQLSALIGRPTTPMAATVKATIA
ncbi:SDR family oxidoreductase [Pseudooceanicola onchidii]|uniref:SDR family oxidoreductase n=1 Tax=Pseudooceanicola onchidii TaxID=2562279 RepID=UPI0010AA4FFE|nr:SDR family oxidoreductase [Pseudooceanicola onchidii]